MDAEPPSAIMALMLGGMSGAVMATRLRRGRGHQLTGGIVMTTGAWRRRGTIEIGFDKIRVGAQRFSTQMEIIEHIEELRSALEKVWPARVYGPPDDVEERPPRVPTYLN
jgi:hypothetical protein